MTEANAHFAWVALHKYMDDYEANGGDKGGKWLLQVFAWGHPEFTADPETGQMVPRPFR